MSAARDRIVAKLAEDRAAIGMVDPDGRYAAYDDWVVAPRFLKGMGLDKYGEPIDAARNEQPEARDKPIPTTMLMAILEAMPSDVAAAWAAERRYPPAGRPTARAKKGKPSK